MNQNRNFSRAKLIFFLLFVNLYIFTTAQDLKVVRTDLNFLCSKKCWGRGYTKNGMSNASKFLEKRLRKLGIDPLVPGKYNQELVTSVNTFPGKMQVKINGKKLVPGKDFIVGNESSSNKGVYRLEKRDSITWIGKNELSSNLVILKIEKKLTWSVSLNSEPYTMILLSKESIGEDPMEVELNIESNIISDFNMKNILGYVKGTVSTDSFIVFTAHYDHLGGMGSETFFPGANDNASGVCMLLQLAEYYKKNPPLYSVAFIFFCGEEAGLLGSKFYVENPIFPLSKIKFLINLDLLGTGDEGITVVNATEFKKEYEMLKSINSKTGFLQQIKPRGKAANSDHYWFTQKGVSGFFIYTLGGIKAYHDIFDKPETLPLSKFSDLFKLLISFEGAITKNN
ncbi:MAG: M28 family metallopeptidase [Bacteroidota bacterium]|jgi:aminopeptidase YwaD